MASANLTVVAVFNKSNPIVVAVKVKDGVLLRQMTVQEGDTVVGTITNMQDRDQKEVLQGHPGEKVYAIRIEAPESQEPMVIGKDLKAFL